MIKSHYFAYLKRLRWINRWSLMRNTYTENVMEHSWEVAVIAHTLAIIKNKLFDGNLDANLIATVALYHDASEVLTGDMPTPVKYHNPEIYASYKEIEKIAGRRIISVLPDELMDDLFPFHCRDDLCEDARKIIDAADKISAYLKCYAEVDAGNHEFTTASTELLEKIHTMKLPESDYFMAVFVDSCICNLDNIMK